MIVNSNYGNINIVTREGSKTDESVVREIFEENVYHLHDNMFSENGIVLDIGANIGAFTLNVLERAKNNGYPVTIIAIEPEPSNVKIFKKNLKLNSHLVEKSTVILLENAIGHAEKFVKISDEHGDSRISDEGTDVPMITLDHLFEVYELDKVDFAKFDIEGYEVPTIARASQKTINMIHRNAIEFDEQNTNEDFHTLIDKFIDNSSFYTLGVPSRGCYLYTENHKWES